MNRIRKVSDGYQVLVSPKNDRIRFTMERWIHNIPSMRVEQYKNLPDAQIVAMDQPDLNWFELGYMHKHEFIRLKNIIQDHLDVHKITVEFKSRIKEASSIKNKVFDSLIGLGNHDPDFLNDVIGFRIVNPWLRNLKSIANALQKIPELAIVKKREVENNIIMLYGETSVGTLFEIQLMPTAFHQWYEWQYNRIYLAGIDKEKASPLIDKMFKECSQLQKTIDDSGFILK